MASLFPVFNPIRGCAIGFFWDGFIILLYILVFALFYYFDLLIWFIAF